MAPQPIKVLLVEDDEDYYVLTRDLLREIEPGRYALDWIEHFAAGLEAMTRRPYDVCLLDYDLGEKTGLELLQAARQAGCDAPIIMLTGQGGYDVDLAAMQAGAADYVIKAGINATRLERAIRYALERAHTLKALQQRERHIAELYAQEQSRSRELGNAYADLRRAELHRDELVQMLAHDLRGPLTAILGNLDLMERATREPAGAGTLPRLLARTQKNARRIVAMIDDLLAVSRLEAGALHPSLEPLHLPALLADKTLDYRLQAEQCHQSFSAQVPEELPRIWADADLIGRVIDNLLANALKFTPPGGQIAISAACRDSSLIVSVSDDGPGIAAEHQARIFEKYYQVTSGDGPAAAKGAGIGLTFCRLAVEAHGGRIWVESSPNQGSVFYFNVPLCP